MLLQSSGLGTDATLKNDLTLAGVLTHGTEGTFTNVVRRVYTATDIFISINTGTGVVTLDVSDLVINSAGGALNNTLGALVLAYRPASASADSVILPLTKHDVTATTTGGNLTIAIPSVGTST